MAQDAEKKEVLAALAEEPEDEEEPFEERKISTVEMDVERPAKVSLPKPQSSLKK